MNDDRTMSDDVATRLDRLERSVRIWRGATIGLVALVAGAGLLGAAQAQKTPKVLRAQQFELEGAGGKTLATLERTGNGAKLSLSNDKNVSLVSISSGGGAANLMLIGQGGKSLVAMSAADPDTKAPGVKGIDPAIQGATIDLTDQDGKMTLLLTADVKQKSVIRAIKDGKTVLQTP